MAEHKNQNKLAPYIVIPEEGPSFITTFMYSDEDDVRKSHLNAKRLIRITGLEVDIGVQFDPKKFDFLKPIDSIFSVNKTTVAEFIEGSGFVIRGEGLTYASAVELAKWILKMTKEIP